MPLNPIHPRSQKNAKIYIIPASSGHRIHIKRCTRYRARRTEAGLSTQIGEYLVLSVDLRILPWEFKVFARRSPPKGCGGVFRFSVSSSPPNMSVAVAHRNSQQHRPRSATKPRSLMENKKGVIKSEGQSEKRLPLTHSSTLPFC